MPLYDDFVCALNKFTRQRSMHIENDPTNFDAFIMDS